MGKKKKSKSKSIWSRIRSNPKAFGEILAGFGDMYAASKGKKPNAVVPKGQQEAGAAAPQQISPTDPFKHYPNKRR
jgi:hypothetical protein